MFKHLAIPLDGSGLAESVLPTAARLAFTLEADVTLIHIIESDAPERIHGERHLTRADEAEAYLEEVGKRFFADPARVFRHVHTAPMRDVARGIALHQHELEADLVVMCTHGRGGIHEWLFGRIAQQVVATGVVPVLLIRPDPVCREKCHDFDRILSPTDANPAHAEGPEVAFGLARALSARLDLLTVVPTAGTLAGPEATMERFMPGATRITLEMAEADRQVFLQKLAARFKDRGIAVTARLERGEPAAVIVHVAEASDAGLIVLCTHGKAGTEAFWSRSIAARVLGQSVRPALLVPV